MKEGAPSPLLEAVIARLREVIDPETNADVMRMRLIEDLTVDRDGMVCYIFRPSSPFCPIAVTLATQIKQAVAEVPGVTDQQIKIEDYVAAEELTQLINQEN
ncbi:MAG: iron-sulfur cluster assembly protein [Anaerolineales bacterium]|nr:iron-sulfur cluster assembly protein [Anaerolineales bacterium]